MGNEPGTALAAAAGRLRAADTKRPYTAAIDLIPVMAKTCLETAQRQGM